MVDRDIARQILEQQKAEINIYSEMIRRIVGYAPYIYNEQRLLAAKLDYINNAPDEYLEKIDESALSRGNLFVANLPVLPVIDEHIQDKLFNSSGTVFPFQETLYSAIQHNPDASSWATPILSVFNEVIEESINTNELPGKLNSLRTDLGRMFTVAVDSYKKAQQGIITVDQSAIQLRDVLQQLWGALVNKARGKCVSSLKGYSHMELGTDSNREKIANCLALSSDVSSLTGLLNNMFELSKELSASNYGKNPLGTDVDQLSGDYHRWLGIITDIMKIVV